jgi:hypothetical protein
MHLALRQVWQLLPTVLSGVRRRCASVAQAARDGSHMSPRAQRECRLHSRRRIAKGGKTPLAYERYKSAYLMPQWMGPWMSQPSAFISLPPLFKQHILLSTGVHGRVGHVTTCQALYMLNAVRNTTAGRIRCGWTMCGEYFRLSTFDDHWRAHSAPEQTGCRWTACNSQAKVCISSTISLALRLMDAGDRI